MQALIIMLSIVTGMVVTFPVFAAGMMGDARDERTRIGRTNAGPRWMRVIKGLGSYSIRKLSLNMNLQQGHFILCDMVLNSCVPAFSRS